MRRAVYAGSFDPPTNGHLWMIQEAAQLFDELIVAVGNNPDKRCTFSIQERVDMLKVATKGIQKLRIEIFEHMFLVNYAQKMSANYILRGIRGAADYEYERIMRYINADLHPSITTIFLLPPREYAEISSTMIKNLIGPVGWEKIVSQYLPTTIYESIIAYYQQRKNQDNKKQES